MYKYKLLIVLYNKEPKESETILSLSRMTDEIVQSTSIYIWDNSSKPLSDSSLLDLESLLKPFHYQYNCVKENVSLSKIYNYVIKNELIKDQILLIFDHDSNITKDYFIELAKSEAQYPDINLYLPIIKYKGTIVSPANSWYFKGSYWAEEKFGLVEAHHQNAINSGMAIRGSYLKNTFQGYDENLRFYGTDSDFMYQYSLQNKYFCVTHAVVNHTLDFFDNKDIDSRLSRFKQMRTGALINMRKINFIIYLLCYVYFVFCSFKLVISSKDFRFLTLK